LPGSGRVVAEVGGWRLEVGVETGKDEMEMVLMKKPGLVIVQ